MMYRIPKVDIQKVKHSSPWTVRDELAATGCSSTVGQSYLQAMQGSVLGHWRTRKTMMRTCSDREVRVVVVVCAWKRTVWLGLHISKEPMRICVQDSNGWNSTPWSAATK